MSLALPELHTVVLLLSVVASIAFLIAVLVGMGIHGPVRWVRLCTVGLVITGFVDLGLLVSPRAALGMLAFTTVFTTLSSTVAVLAWSTPAELLPEPHPFDPPDPLLRARAEGWGRELESHGHQHSLDYWTTWKLGGQTRRTWSRIFTHPDRHGWVEIAVLVQPKVAALRALTPLVDERLVETSNRRSDAAVLGDRGTIATKVPEGARVVDLLLAHDAALNTTGTAPRPISEVLAAATESHRAFTGRLIANGTLVRKGDRLRIRLRALPGILGHTFADLVRG